MNFLRRNIDRAIVMTQYDLRGFAHPGGWRAGYAESPKALAATTANFIGFAAGLGGGEKTPTDENFVSYFGSTYEDYLAMCQRLAADCDGSEKEAIQLIVREIVKQSEQMKAEVDEGKREASSYLMPLEKDNNWGKAVLALALAEAFEVELEPVAA